MLVLAYYDDDGRLTTHSKSIGSTSSRHDRSRSRVEPENCVLSRNVGRALRYKFSPTMEALLRVACMATNRPFYLRKTTIST
jgi:aldehyde oxidoreductase